MVSTDSTISGQRDSTGSICGTELRPMPKWTPVASGPSLPALAPTPPKSYERWIQYGAAHAAMLKGCRMPEAAIARSGIASESAWKIASMAA